MDTSSYEAASRHFIHRDFASVQEELGPTGPSASTPAWVSYLALCERAFLEPDREDWPFNSEQRKQLRNAILKSHIWAEMELRWDAIDEKVPHSSILSGFKLALRHKSDPRPIITFMEHYIATGEVPNDVFIAFVEDILVSLQHDFFYAKESVKQHAEVDQESMSAGIDAAEEQYEQDIMQALEEQKRQEEQRLSDAMAASSQTASHSEANGDATSTKIAGDQFPKGINADSKNTSGVDAIVESEASRNADLARSEKSNVPSRQRRTLTEHWKHWFHHFIRSQGLYNTVLCVILIAGIVSSRRARVTLLRSSRWLWQSLKNGINMGLRVTYL